MALSEFRFNKKRKHYAYLHKKIGGKRVNILISTKPVMVRRKYKNKKKKVKVIMTNVPLFHHPNPEKEGQFYLIPVNYVDDAVVSSDILGGTAISYFDAQAGLSVNDKLVKLVAWYDNEVGYSNKVLDLAKHVILHP